MNKFLIGLCLLSFSALTNAAEGVKCGGKYTVVSCENVQGAKRDYFCSKKGTPEADKITKYCTKDKKKFAKKQSKRTRS